MGTKWTGYGVKIRLATEYLKSIKDKYTHFIFVDAYDVIFLYGLDKIEKVYEDWFKDKILFSAEKGCWPDPNLADKYPDVRFGYPWKYLNSGAYMAPIDKYLEVVSKYKFLDEDDDQRYFTKIFLDGHINLDYGCEIFQSYSFIEDEDFEYFPGRLYNKRTMYKPSIIHGNGRTDMTEVCKLSDYQTYNFIDSIAKIWDTSKEYNVAINEAFIERVNAIPELKEHRDWIEANIWGFGERSFGWMWYLLVQEMPKEFTFLEIGVFRGAILSLLKIISIGLNKKVKRYGVTPLSPAEIGWESDYREDIRKVHTTFDIPEDYTIIKGDSTDKEVIKKTEGLELDILYIDGCHTYECVKSDIINYSRLIKKGGYLVIDDSACRFSMPFGYFTGIITVCDAVDELLPPFGDGFSSAVGYTHLFNVVHNRVWRKNY